MSDRAGIIYASQINYKANPAKLGRVFWRLSRATPEARGHDPSAVRILRGSPEYDAMVAWRTKTLPVDDHARELFVETLEEDCPWYRLTVQCQDRTQYFLVAKPTYIAPGLVGRGTHGFVAYNVGDPKRPFAYMKDCWRLVSERSKQEGKILAYLNTKGVRYIPTLLCHGDVSGQETATQKLWQHFNASSGMGSQMETRQHYRLVVNEVGKPLYEFSNGKQLVKIITECVFAHKEAYDKAKVIHRNISVGNLLMVPVGKTAKGETIYRGLLTDWEFSKCIEKRNLKSRYPGERTGAWQYMSVNALSLPCKEIDVVDDLESFLYVLIWCAIRYLPHTCVDVDHFMYNFFDHAETNDCGEYTCSLLKRLAISAGHLLTSTQKRIVFLCSSFPTFSDASAAPRDSAPAIATPILESSPSTPLADAPSAPLESCVLPSNVPGQDSHPIHAVVSELLQRFMWFYKLQELTHEHRGVQLPMAVDDSPDDLYSLDSSVRFDTDDSVANMDTDSSHGATFDFTYGSIPAHARDRITKAVINHRVFGEVLANALRDKTVDWPENDRHADQLDQGYRLESC
ncbi:hypothetical protein ONZ51_g6779 [Trametes cubensis]|uniref:Fungal-type protein kinase domain-containing protein n=1 Tax=Trametes cubensis TaxID=1111947 RepID=A0AAD7TTV5_9APHY|nr:hypothetical protein ONZ51_g6779 [Trametes cubensis]